MSILKPVLQSKVLRNVASRVTYVDFDVTNPEHLVAYACLTQFGRQHPTLRFNLKGQSVDVHSMMNAAVAAHFIKQHPHIIGEASKLVGAAADTAVAA